MKRLALTLPTLLVILPATPQIARSQDGAPLVATTLVDASTEAVWNAYTTREGVVAWQIDNVSEIEMRIGARWRASYDPDSNLDDDTVIENEVLAFDPGRMWAVRTVLAPSDFPFPNAILDTWTVLYLEPAGEGQTLVSVRMFGFDDSEESVRMREFFEWGNQYELNQLAEHLASH